MTFNTAQQHEINLYRSTFPFRIIFAALHPITGEWQVGAVMTKHKPNKLARTGWNVWIVS
jgi:hypothetical protein